MSNTNIMKVIVICLILTLTVRRTEAQVPNYYGTTWSPDGTKIAGTGANFLKIWDATGNLLVDLSNDITVQIVSISWSNDSSKIALLFQDNNPVRIYAISVPSISAGTLLDTFVPPIGADGFVSDIAWTQDDSKLIISARATDKNFVIWDLILNEAINVSNEGWTEMMALDPDSDLLILSDINSPPRLISIYDSRFKQTLIGSASDPIASAIAWSPLSTYIALGSYEGDFRIYNASTLQLLRTVSSGSTKYIASVGFSSDESKLITSNTDGLVQIWEVETGSLLRTLNFNRLVSASFNPVDNRLLFNNPDSNPIVLPSWCTSLPPTPIPLLP